jgi:uncharacterized membrane protein YfcA
MEYLLYLCVGAVAGLLGGLLGIGGGLVIVPVLVYSFAAQGFDQSVLTQMAVGTSLATIIFTSFSSVKAHHARGAVRWELVRHIAPGIIVGTLVGAQIAHFLPGRGLQALIGIFAILMAIQMFTNWRPGNSGPEAPALPGTKGLTMGGGLIGAASALFGIGGGSLTVPWLSYHAVRMQEAVATSSACGMVIAVAGTVGFVATGWGLAELPQASTGYVYLPAFIGISLSSILFARLGVALAHRMKAESLKKAFALLLVVVGLKMLTGAI